VTIEFDLDARVVNVDGRRVDLYSDDGFRIVKDLWLKVSWSQKYVYTFTWFGIPIIQLPDDILRYQETVFDVRPDVIIETGIAHGGSLVFAASLCKLMGKGRVIGIDIELRPHNRQRLDAHPLRPLITVIEGSSTAPEVVDQVRSLIAPGESTLVVLDSNHGYAHVMDELLSYAPLVTPGSYLVATDGIMEDLATVPGGKPEWARDNPARAASDFAARNPQFRIAEPAWRFNESTLTGNVTHWPGAWLRRVSE
jgi:cephalosporin hydroxylase